MPKYWCNFAISLMKHIMLHRTQNFRFLGVMTLIWLLAGFACVASDGSATAVVDACVLQEQDEVPASAVDNNQHHLYACVAESISLTNQSEQLRTGGKQTRAQQRTEGGRQTNSVTRVTTHSTFTWHQCRHYALASSGVAFISSRACDYYVFALRHILD